MVPPIGCNPIPGRAGTSHQNVNGRRGTDSDTHGAGIRLGGYPSREEDPVMRARLLVAAFISMAAACASSAAPALADAPATTPLPVIYNGFYGYSHASSTASPPGANT